MSFLDGKVVFTRVGGVVYVSVHGAIDMGDDAWATIIIGTLPNSFRPENEVFIGLTVQSSTAIEVLSVTEDGTVKTRSLGGAAPMVNWAFGGGSYPVA